MKSSPALPAHLQKDLDAVSQNPSSFDAVFEYGDAAMKGLGALATQMLAAQGAFSEGLSEVHTALGRVDKAITKLGHGDDPFSKAHRKLKEEFDVMAAAARKIEDSRRAARALAGTRCALAQDLSDLIAAGKEVLDDYATRHIPGAESEEEEALLRRRAEDFAQRLTMLEGAKASAVVAGQQMAAMTQTMDGMLGSVSPMLDRVKNLYLGPLLDREEKEAAERAMRAIEKISQGFRDGTEKPVTVKKPLQFRPK